MIHRKLYKQGDKVTIKGPLQSHQQGHVSIGQTYEVDIDYEDLIYLKNLKQIYFYPEQLK